MKIESKTQQKARLIIELAKSIGYWSDINPDYANAYTLMLNAFTRMDAEQPINREQFEQEDENI